MDITKLTIIVSFILALSVASERLVEILKGGLGKWWDWWNKKGVTDNAEAGRHAGIHFLAIVSGIITAFLVYEFIPDNGLISDLPGVVAYGILASGGSGLWNSILTYFLNIKDIKDNLAKDGQKKLDANVPLVQ